MKKNTVTLIDNSVGKRYEYNILESTRGSSVVDIFRHPLYPSRY